MADKFVTVMTFNQSFEAKLAKNLLENEGIESLMSGEHTSDVLFGNVGLGDQIFLQVREGDAQRAAGLLASVAAAKLDDDWEEQAEAGVWLCSICGEPISNLLSVCYSCQTPRESIRTAAPRDTTAIQSHPVTLPTGEEVQKRDEIAETPSPEPPLTPAPQPPPQEEMETDVVPSATAANDDLARRAFLASILGAGTGLLLLVSWYYLLRAIVAGGEMSPTGERYLYGALLINALFILVMLIVCAGGLV